MQLREGRWKQTNLSHIHILLHLRYKLESQAISINSMAAIVTVGVQNSMCLHFQSWPTVGRYYSKSTHLIQKINGDPGKGVKICV